MQINPTATDEVLPCFDDGFILEVEEVSYVESPSACSFLTNQEDVVGNVDKGDSRRGSAHVTPKL